MEVKFRLKVIERSEMFKNQVDSWGTFYIRLYFIIGFFDFKYQKMQLLS